MKLRRQPQVRSAFTLVELLVVMAIIVILMSLLLAGVNKIWSYTDEVKTTNEIAQLSQALEAFKAKFGRYPPSRIALWCNNEIPVGALQLPANDAAGQLARESMEFLQAMFPGIDLVTPNSPSSKHDWTGTGFSSQTPLVLEGQECLVFFLGGIRYLANGVYSGFTGFCTDTARPTLPNLNVAGAQRTRPFFDFDMNRIVQNAQVNPNAGSSNNLFAVYLDPYKTPYAYFAARAGSSNNYAADTNNNPQQNSNIYLWGYTANRQALLDCYNLINFYQPPNLQRLPTQSYDPTYPGARYAFVQNLTGSVATYFRSNSFQIISAGKDRMFGDNTAQLPFGNPWVADSSNPLLFPEAMDNITNFSSGVLVAK